MNITSSIRTYDLIVTVPNIKEHRLTHEFVDMFCSEVQCGNGMGGWDIGTDMKIEEFLS